MTEAEWLATTDPERMLWFLRANASDRKLRLFACACCRSVWAMLVHHRSQDAVIAAEAYADAFIGDRELELANYDAIALTGSSDSGGWMRHYQTGAIAAFVAATPPDRDDGDEPDAVEKPRLDPVSAAFHAAEGAARSVAEADAQYELYRYGSPPAGGSLAAQADLLRDIFGNPFLPVSLDPSWLSPAVISLARTIYGDRTFDRMPELADALERAGCSGKELLGHCRGPGPHVRGCWVVDLVLGKA